MAKNVRLFDIQEAVTQWAWHEFVDTESRKQKKMRKKEEKNPGMYIGIEIDWSNVLFHDETKWPKLLEAPFKQDESSKPSENSTPVVKFTDNNQNANPTENIVVAKVPTDHVADHRQYADSGKTHVSTLFQTKFTNNTDDEQEYTMKTEKTTRSECTTEIENSWSKSFEMSIGLKAPNEIFEANAGYSREFSLTNTLGQTFEEELCWGVESQIKVKKGHIAEASLVVNEKKYTGTFLVETSLQGDVYISFTNKRDNNAHIKATGHDIGEIVEWYQAKKRRVNAAFNYVTVENNVVKIKTKGKCNFRFGINQEVVVHQKPLLIT